MDKKGFLGNYLWPSEDKLDRSFTFPLPEIEGLEEREQFFIQCEQEDTFSINIISKYESDILGVTVKEVYKNTQNKFTGVFVRLVGTMSIVKNGYPRLSLDAPITNVSLVSGDKEELKTRVFVMLPQADAQQRHIFSSNFNQQAKAGNIALQEFTPPDQADFWGPITVAETKGADLDTISTVRKFAWNTYKQIISETGAKIPFDYRPFQEYMVFDTAQRESGSFKTKGLSVPIEAQAAFFSVTIPHL